MGLFSNGKAGTCVVCFEDRRDLPEDSQAINDLIHYGDNGLVHTSPVIHKEPRGWGCCLCDLEESDGSLYVLLESPGELLRHLELHRLEGDEIDKTLVMRLRAEIGMRARR